MQLNGKLVGVIAHAERHFCNYANIRFEGGKYEMPIRKFPFGGARGVVVIVVGNGYGDTSSNPGRD